MIIIKFNTSNKSCQSIAPKNKNYALVIRTKAFNLGLLLFSASSFLLLCDLSISEGQICQPC